MKLGIITSFLIGGLLMLATIRFNTRVMQESVEITMNVSNKSHLEALRQVISHDFSRIGFGEGNQINTLKSWQIVFKADIYGDGTSVVKWQFNENKKVKETPNPNDRVLTRHGPVNSTGAQVKTTFHVVDFSITAYEDTSGETETTDPDKIKSLRVEIVFESPEEVGSQGYAKTVWRKLIIPNNLQFKNLNSSN
jgi:hypothetical protein